MSFLTQNDAEKIRLPKKGGILEFAEHKTQQDLTRKN
jgi:hypothetical protein